LVSLTEEIYEVRRWDGFMQHDIRTKFHHDRFRHLSNIRVITATIWEAVMLVLLIGEIYELRRWDCFMWHNIFNICHEDWYGRSSNIKV
jgi:hypothetical protein